VSFVTYRPPHRDAELLNVPHRCQVPLHPADLETDTIDAELEASNETRMSRELEEIDAALHRLYHTPERFGICEETGQPIPFERLDIVPWARTCDQAGA
jgi:DnaK suppressor protein